MIEQSTSYELIEQTSGVTAVKNIAANEAHTADDTGKNIVLFRGLKIAGYPRPLSWP